MKLTRGEPGYYSDMLNELAKIDNTVPEKRITYPNIEAARKAMVKFTDMLFSINNQEAKCIKVELRTGEIKTLVFTDFEMPVSEYTKPVSIIVRKSIDEYTCKPNSAGSYKHCEGGGWHSMANLYELNGKFYTDAY
ncbi:MAG: hypothetical protein JWR05_3521 [Mucilaginibacter sp.]|nr:hypothetical protein [Mucilaginibacter sp.]